MAQPQVCRCPQILLHYYGIACKLFLCSGAYSQAAAQEALVLHGMQLDTKFGLTVLISDPAAKVKRSDTTDSSLFVGGLTDKTTEEDVRQLFRGVSRDLAVAS